jgi:hypothetical protein
MSKWEIAGAMLLVAAAVIWFFEQQQTQTSATETSGSLNTSTAGTP